MLLDYECPLCLISDALILRFSLPEFHGNIRGVISVAEVANRTCVFISVVFEIRKIEFQSFSSGKRIITYQKLPWVAGWISG